MASATSLKLGWAARVARKIKPATTARQRNSTNMKPMTSGQVRPGRLSSSARRIGMALPTEPAAQASENAFSLACVAGSKIIRIDRFFAGAGTQGGVDARVDGPTQDAGRAVA